MKDINIFYFLISHYLGSNIHTYIYIYYSQLKLKSLLNIINELFFNKIIY